MFYMLSRFYLYSHPLGPDLGNKNMAIISRLKYTHISRRARLRARAPPLLFHSCQKSPHPIHSKNSNC